MNLCYRLFLVTVVIESVTIKPVLQLTPAKVHYSVQPYPIYYPDETADVIYFDGSTIEFTCKYFCEHDCDSQVYYKTRDKSFCLVDENLCEAPFDFNITYHPGYPANVTVKITNANVSSAGSYQCLTPAWHTTYVINKETNFQMAVLGSAKQEIKLVSSGDSVFLPCVINASNNIYPQPDHIEWWKGNIRCDPPLQCKHDLFVTQDGGLLLTNYTATNVSYHCVVYWSNKVYNASQYHIVIHQPDGYHVRVHPESLMARVGESVQFVCVVGGFGQNYSIKWYRENALLTTNHSHMLDLPVIGLNYSATYYCVVNNKFGDQINTSAVLQVMEPPHIDDIKDVFVDINVLDNMTFTLNCSFSGHPTPTVYWMRMFKYRKRLVYFNDNTTVIGNTAVLHLSNIAKNDLGSYQCVAINEAGYVSRTARILPKGWTNGVRNLKVVFIDTENYTMRISWEPPDYIGGVPVKYYKLLFYDLRNIPHKEKMLEDSLNTTTYLWDELGQYNHSGMFRIRFGVIVSDILKNNRSIIARTSIYTERKLPSILKATLKVDCTGDNINVEWELKQRSSSDDIEGYCLNYKCNTSLKSEQDCWLDSSISRRSISGVPTNATCQFTLVVRSNTAIESNEVTCFRNNVMPLSSPSSQLLRSSLSLLMPAPSSIIMPLSSSVLSMPISTSHLSPSPVIHTTLLTDKLNTTNNIVSTSNIEEAPSNKAGNENPIIYILLMVVIVLLSSFGGLVAILVLKKKKSKKDKFTREPPGNNEAFIGTDFDYIKEESEVESIPDEDLCNVFDNTLKHCDTEKKMYERITNPSIFDSTSSLASITGSNIVSNGDDSDIGEASSSKLYPSHYCKPNGVDNSGTQMHNYDSGNSVVDNDVSLIDEGSSAKMS